MSYDDSIKRFRLRAELDSQDAQHIDTVDLPQRLREFTDQRYSLGAMPRHLVEEAAAEIERLRGQVTMLRHSVVNY